MPTMRNCSQQLGHHSRWKKSTHENRHRSGLELLPARFALFSMKLHCGSLKVARYTLIDSDFRHKVGKKLLPIWSTDKIDPFVHVVTMQTRFRAIRIVVTRRLFFHVFIFVTLYDRTSHFYVNRWSKLFYDMIKKVKSLFPLKRLHFYNTHLLELVGFYL